MRQGTRVLRHLFLTGLKLDLYTKLARSGFQSGNLETLFTAKECWRAGAQIAESPPECQQHGEAEDAVSQTPPPASAHLAPGSVALAQVNSGGRSRAPKGV